VNLQTPESSIIANGPPGKRIFMILLSCL